MQAMEISRSGLDVEWQRLEIIAQNLANVSTTRTITGEPYRAMRLVSGPAGDFASLLDKTSKSHAARGVEVLGVEPMATHFRRVHDPKHPHADANGFVSFPDIDHAGEMTLMIKTSRAYEANLTAMSIAQQMYTRALELGRQA